MVCMMSKDLYIKFAVVLGCPADQYTSASGATATTSTAAGESAAVATASAAAESTAATTAATA